MQCCDPVASMGPRWQLHMAHGLWTRCISTQVSSTCSCISYTITQQSLFQSKAFPWFQESPSINTRCSITNTQIHLPTNRSTFQPSICAPQLSSQWPRPWFRPRSPHLLLLPHPPLLPVTGSPRALGVGATLVPGTATRARTRVTSA